jgi:predicted DNA-binding ribbon-helix-helix protein
MKKPIGRPASTIAKHSIVIAGHATSISLEDAFWSSLKAIASERKLTTAALIAEVDSGRHGANLSSAIRVFVLDHYRRSAPSLLSSGQQP